ncbi:MAG: UbiD family decarboxylase [Planctomycetes bacterium]|nr:UbiD family decarboxylase [Planctomycetota bacterium]
MNHLRSLREYVERLKALGEIQEIDVEVDWNLEMGAVIRRSYELQTAAPLFNRIRGIEPGFRVLGAPAGVSKSNGLVRIALSLGLPTTASAREIIETLAAAHAKTPIPPRRVATGPCKENKLLGDAVDLYRLPAPYIHDGDGGRYLNTWGTIVVRTPAPVANARGSAKRWTNWSITRIMLHGKRTLVGAIIPRQHLGMIFAQWKAINQPMPFALAIGTEPVIPFVSGMPLDEYVDEADFIGGYLGEPVDVVDCETVDLQVPATSEIVIEGTVSPTETAPEGPMGEYSGYLSPGGGMPSPIFHVSAITYRHGAILPVIAAGEPIEENHTCWGLTVSAQLLWELRQADFPVTACFIPFQSAAHWLVVTVPVDALARSERLNADALTRRLGEIVFRSRSGSFIPKVILIGDDIDPTNLDELVWAFATRNHPATGQVLFPDQPVLPLVAFLSGAERQAKRGTKVIYNCLPPSDRSADETPRRSSFRFLWPKEVQEKVLANWQRYGFDK